MRSLATIEAGLDSRSDDADARESARRLLFGAEQVLEHWVVARGETPTIEQREGFRLLALHRQGARSEPSFNACRETCREIAYHYNLLCAEPDSANAEQRRCMMTMLVKHLVLFVSGKLQMAGLGEFCCSSRPLRIESA